jgi:phenylalanine-4-hydroxylase
MKAQVTRQLSRIYAVRRFGEIGCKAISSDTDYQMYEAIRLLSIVKEAEDTPQATIDEAEKQ